MLLRALLVPAFTMALAGSALAQANQPAAPADSTDPVAGQVQTDPACVRGVAPGGTQPHMARVGEPSSRGSGVIASPQPSSSTSAMTASTGATGTSNEGTCP